MSCQHVYMHSRFQLAKFILHLSPTPKRKDFHLGVCGPLRAIF